MTSFHIRRGVASDAKQLAAFAARVFAETFGADNRPEDMRTHLTSAYGVAQQTRELTDPDLATLLAHHEGALVAYAQVRRGTPPPCVWHQQPIELYRFYVDRPLHGSGLAQMLMATAFDAGRAFGGHHLWLSVWERNPRALAFYKREGFSDVGSTYFFVGPDRQTDRVLVAGLAEA